MTFSEEDDAVGLGKQSPMILMVKEDLAAHSVEVLTLRLKALRAEIMRTDQAIASKGKAKDSAENFFK